jgi:hypothetical protein
MGSVGKPPLTATLTGKGYSAHWLTSQDAQLHEAGCAKVYSEKVSGAKNDRAELGKLLKRLEPGDVLMVTRLDRLARSTRDLLNILDTIAKAGAGFKSLADQWAETTTAHGRLMLTILGGGRDAGGHSTYLRREPRDDWTARAQPPFRGRKRGRVRRGH